ncbi:MAG: hypothetical protein FWE06_01675 [Oscillospiraceae bacterium]|nr:hypothetical protein [Oscillospiraceae bacterium]
MTKQKAETLWASIGQVADTFIEEAETVKVLPWKKRQRKRKQVIACGAIAAGASGAVALTVLLLRKRGVAVRAVKPIYICSN